MVINPLAPSPPVGLAHHLVLSRLWGRWAKNEEIETKGKKKEEERKMQQQQKEKKTAKGS